MKLSANISYLFLIAILLSSCSNAYKLSDYGLIPNSKENASPLFAKALAEIKQASNGKKVTIKLAPGKYNFYPDSATMRDYYISNHDQGDIKAVGLAFENMQNITFDGQGAELIFHGRMLPISVTGSQNMAFKNFSIDFENPHISQVKVIENDTINAHITFEIAPWVNYEIRDSVFVAVGLAWEHVPRSGIAFEEKTKRLVYRTGDIRLGTGNVAEISPRIIKSYNWKNPRLIPGTIIAMRSSGRPTPGIFLYHNTNTFIDNVNVHYAEGMGLLAQMSENISLNKFSVCLRGEGDPRYFTTQADATHFSGCKGKIISNNGLYEGMMDDAINVHGTYLKVTKRINDNTLAGKYMHSQSYGFEWGRIGDTVQFINSKTMEIVGAQNKIASIQATDKPTEHGAKEFEIKFEHPLDSIINENESFGIENLEWTPTVTFSNNIIRNNRARGTLFSTPKQVVISDNTFDHTSGTAILLCGDCNGWYETGACKKVIINDNKFINSLTNMFQFTNAVISIYPVIPDLENQKQYFHSDIIIRDNHFETFDQPILYAKSVDGLVFRDNTIVQNNAYPAFHWNKHRFFIEHVINFDITNNHFDSGFDIKKDLRNE